MENIELDNCGILGGLDENGGVTGHLNFGRLIYNINYQNSRKLWEDVAKKTRKHENAKTRQYSHSYGGINMVAYIWCHISAIVLSLRADGLE